MMQMMVENNPGWDMNILFECDRYVVVALASLAGTLYEIVDKQTREEVCLTGRAADSFMTLREQWTVNVPHEDDVVEALEAYTALGRLPLYIH